jgi:hypothetical protein
VDSLGLWVYAVLVLHGFAEGALFTALFAHGADIIPPDRRTRVWPSSVSPAFFRWLSPV